MWSRVKWPFVSSHFFLKFTNKPMLITNYSLTGIVIFVSSCLFWISTFKQVFIVECLFLWKICNPISLKLFHDPEPKWKYIYSGQNPCSRQEQNGWNFQIQRYRLECVNFLPLATFTTLLFLSKKMCFVVWNPCLHSHWEISEKNTGRIIVE